MLDKNPSKATIMEDNGKDEGMPAVQIMSRRRLPNQSHLFFVHREIFTSPLVSANADPKE
jgi:hypothetical protein